MKYLVLLIVVVGALWFARALRQRRDASAPDKPAERPSPGAKPAATLQEPMIACAQCGVHVPQGESVPGRGGLFCGDKHRADFERQHPKP